MKSVITITLNPAIDLTGHLDELRPGEVNLVHSASRRAAGKGINVASVLAEMGAKVTATGFLGEDNVEEFEQLFKQRRIHDAFIRIPGRTRENVKLAGDHGQVTDINFPGFRVGPTARQALLDQVRLLASQDTLVVIAGSLPQGIKPEFYAELVREAKRAGSRVVLDTSGAALQAALQAGPDLAKPNLEELAALVGRELSLDDLPVVAKQLLTHPAQSLVVSLGGDGLLTFGEMGHYRCQPPKVDVVSTVGAGDTLVAGIAWSWINQLPADYGLRKACALSAWAVTQHGVSVPDASQLAELAEQVQLHKLDAPLAEAV